MGIDRQPNHQMRFGKLVRIRRSCKMISAAKRGTAQQAQARVIARSFSGFRRDVGPAQARIANTRVTLAWPTGACTDCP
jgi:hypothetical protein